jgi:hypothetical protein
MGKRGVASIAFASLFAFLALSLAIGECHGETPSVGVSTADLAEFGGAFAEVAERSGLDFVHFNGMSGEFYLVEIMGSGAALFDCDNDGDLDAYLVQGAMLGPGKSLDDALFPPADRVSPPRDRLFRNELAIGADGSRLLRFVDATEESGIVATGYGMGVAAGDFDNDGWIDLYVAEYAGPNQLWRNRGDGTFEEVAASSGVQDERWSTSVAWVDFDRDGWLDLYVCNYVEYALEPQPKCLTPGLGEDYCGPLRFFPQEDSLFRNRGDGTFEDVAPRALRPPEGIAAESLGVPLPRDADLFFHQANAGGTGRGGRMTAVDLLLSTASAGLGVSCGDLDGDGWPDLYVANDNLPNFLWLNGRDGSFRNAAIEMGCALNADGKPEGSMGVDSGDFDNDGDDDLFMTHTVGQKNTIYANQGEGVFEDATRRYALDKPSIPFTGFGSAWIDYDNNSWLDLFVANGDVRVIPELRAAGDPYPLHQRNQLMRNQSGKKFVDESRAGGDAFKLSEVSRGAAFGDVDNDGDADILVTNNNGRARLLLNLVGTEQPWLGLRLVSKEGRDALGARVEVRRRDAPSLWRRARQDGSYLCSLDPRVLVGLGNDPDLLELIVAWPDGALEAWRGAALPPINAYATLRQGSGDAVAPLEEVGSTE